MARVGERRAPPPGPASALKSGWRLRRCNRRMSTS
jgi:hypothetical protein